MTTAAEHHYGIASAKEIAGLSGREILEAIIAGRLPQAPISQTLTFWIVEVADGFAAFEGEPGPQLLNPMGGVHGGWALTILDSVAGSAGFSTLPPGSRYTTIETKGNLARAISPKTGRIRAEGRALSRGRQIISCEASVKDADGRLLAHGTSTLLVLAS
ncbi:MAG: PaaI family thioesterase [Deltaproteobacteria bacterium]|nr:PaaI family thioesterase [Deltaproteobacteria bacterium]